MAGITVTAERLSRTTGDDLSPEDFSALDQTVRALIALEYSGNPDIAEGRAADVLNAVYMSVAVRLLTNPTGARTVGLGSANVTFGGADQDIANAFTLTTSERADLQTLKASRRASYVRLGFQPFRPYGSAWWRE